jgi:hypothetical protein
MPDQGRNNWRSALPGEPAYRHAVEARAARAQIETFLDAAGWPWSSRLSLWVDALVVLEERR